MNAPGSPGIAAPQRVGDAARRAVGATNLISAMVERVIVPLDGSALAERAVVVAADLASDFGAEISVLCVAENQQEAVELRGYLSELGDRGQLGPMAWHVEVGSDPAALIASVANEVGRSLVCMSSHGHGWLTSALLGSVSTAVLASTDRPVLMVGPKANTGAAGTPVVAYLDGSEISHHALGTAKAWAEALCGGVTMVTVAEPVPASTEPGEPRYRRMFGPRIDADRYLADIAARFTQPGPPIATHAIYDPLSPAEGLIGYLAERPAQLVVMTARQRNGASHAYLGRRAAEIVRSCPVPVLLPPPNPPVGPLTI